MYLVMEEPVMAHAMNAMDVPDLVARLMGALQVIFAGINCTLRNLRNKIFSLNRGIFYLF